VTGDMRVQLAREYLDSIRQHEVTHLPPSVLVRECAELRRQLGQVLDVSGEADDDDGTEPYCTACGQWVGMFHGLDGWHHFRGDPAPGGQRELYDAGHEAVIGWTVPPGRPLSPGQVATVRAGLGDAARYRTDRAAAWCDDCTDHPSGCCERHLDDLEAAERYRALAGQIGGE
jgi:hypothetical protein